MAPQFLLITHPAWYLSNNILNWSGPRSRNGRFYQIIHSWILLTSWVGIRSIFNGLISFEAITQCSTCRVEVRSTFNEPISSEVVTRSRLICKDSKRVRKGLRIRNTLEETLPTLKLESGEEKSKGVHPFFFLSHDYLYLEQNCGDAKMWRRARRSWRYGDVEGTMWRRVRRLWRRGDVEGKTWRHRED